jgi:chemotaxis protein MotB
VDNDYNIEEERESKKEKGGGWLTTYADMMTLLFAFFVLLYSMSSPDPVKMSQIQDAMEKAAGKEGALQTQNQVKENFEEIIQVLGIEKSTNIISDPRGVAIEMDGDICFGSGSTNIKGTLQSILNEAANKILINKKDYRMVIIEGHTDSDKIPAKLQKIYPTNWELSAARASKVVNYLIEQGVNSGRLQASGYADRWPAEATWSDVRSGKITDQTIAEYNFSEQQKQKNRRIKIVFTNN